MQFVTQTFPNFPALVLPNSLQLQYPTASTLPKEKHHFLLFIPWNETYLENVPKKFRPFFTHVLDYLHVRTTDVHTALCCKNIEPLCTAIEAAHPGSKIDRDVVTLSLILHDCGWSQLTETEIAASLGVSGLSLSAEAMGPKEKHAVKGVELAKILLNEFGQDFQLSEKQIELILKSIRYHDQPEKVILQGSAIPLEVQALVDLDHLWSFTQENFWQGVYRKGINDPALYLSNLKNDLDGYFVTKRGREIARSLLSQRTEEVQAYFQS